MNSTDPSIDSLRAAIQLACQPQNVGRIVEGRDWVLSFPRVWVLEKIELVVGGAIDLADYWEYRRLLELAQLLDSALLDRFVAIGLGSADPELREAAEDFRR